MENEYLDTISGTTERRPALGRLMKDAMRRRFDVMGVWRLDRLGRNLKHLIVTLVHLPAIVLRIPMMIEQRLARSRHTYYVGDLAIADTCDRALFDQLLLLEGA